MQRFRPRPACLGRKLAHFTHKPNDPVPNALVDIERNKKAHRKHRAVTSQPLAQALPEENSALRDGSVTQVQAKS
jgi:hypothetical protein